MKEYNYIFSSDGALYKKNENGVFYYVDHIFSDRFTSTWSAVGIIIDTGLRNLRKFIYNTAQPFKRGSSISDYYVDDEIAELLILIKSLSNFLFNRMKNNEEVEEPLMMMEHLHIITLIKKRDFKKLCTSINNILVSEKL